MPRALPPAWEENLLRIVQEVLTNVLRHARPPHFTAQVTFEADVPRLRLADNGQGFDPLRKQDGLGLIGIGERVKLMGGTLEISSAAGTGTTLLIALPLVNLPEAGGA